MYVSTYWGSSKHLLKRDRGHDHHAWHHWEHRDKVLAIEKVIASVVEMRWPYRKCHSHYTVVHGNVGNGKGMLDSSSYKGQKLSSNWFRQWSESHSTEKSSCSVISAVARPKDSHDMIQNLCLSISWLHDPWWSIHAQADSLLTTPHPRLMARVPPVSSCTFYQPSS